MSNLWLDIRYSLRTMLRTPVFTITVILTLAIGIGANTAMFGILNTALIQPLPFEEPDRLVLGYTTRNGSTGFSAVSAPDYFDYRGQADAFASLAAVRFTGDMTVIGRGDPERVTETVISVDLLPTLGLAPRMGRNFTPGEARRLAGVVLVSHGYWLRRFGGDPGAVGQTLLINGAPNTVIGVMPAAFRLPDEVDVFFPMSNDLGEHLARRFHNWRLIGRLKPEVTLEQARGETAVISQRLEATYPVSNRNKALSLSPLRDYYVSDDRASLFALMGAVALVLLIACANVAGLLLARGAARRRELSVRAALGASRGRLVGQLLTESLVVALFSAAGGLLLAGWMQQLLLWVTPLDSLGVNGIETDATVLLFALGLSLLTALVFGAAPALRGARVSPAADLHSGVRATESRAGTRLRTLLAVGQIALSLVLLAEAGLLIRSLSNLQAAELGFQPDNLLTAAIQLPDSSYPEAADRARFHRAFLEKARAVPGVEGAGLINLLPIREPRNNTRVWPLGQEPPDQGDSTWGFTRTVMPGYFETMGIPLLAGRAIDERDQEATVKVAVVNERLARDLYPDTNPIGRKFVVDRVTGEPEALEIAGVVRDVRLLGLGTDDAPIYYAAYPQSTPSTMQLAVRTSGDPSFVVGPLRAALRKIDPDIPLAGIITMDQLIGQSLTDRRIVTGLLLVFSGAAVLLAALGLYGVLAFYVGRHVHEISVRMALGASVRGVLGMIVARGMKVVAAGLLIGIAASFAAVRLMGHLLYNVPTADPLTLAAAVSLFAAVGFLACLIPAHRAAQTDPALTLRSE